MDAARAAFLEALPAHRLGTDAAVGMGDQIAFKLLELDRSWQPTLSGWQEAVVTSVGGEELTLRGTAAAAEELRQLAPSALVDLRIVTRAGAAAGGGAAAEAQGGGGDAAAVAPADGGAAAGGATGGVEVEVGAPRRLAERKRALLASLAAAPAGSPPAPGVVARDAAGDEQEGTAAAAYSVRASVRAQVEYYFSDANLARDRFMREQIAAAPGGGGWVPLSLLLTFNRLKRTGIGEAELAEALATSTQVEVDGATAARVRRRVAYAP